MRANMARSAPGWLDLVVGAVTGVTGAEFTVRCRPRGKLYCLESCARDAVGQPWTEPPGEVPEWSNGAAC
jgi:hypothetical protein